MRKLCKCYKLNLYYERKKIYFSSCSHLKSWMSYFNEMICLFRDLYSQRYYYDLTWSVSCLRCVSDDIVTHLLLSNNNYSHLWGKRRYSVRFSNDEAWSLDCVSLWECWPALFPSLWPLTDTTAPVDGLCVLILYLK